MVPSIVRDEGEFLVVHLQFAVSYRSLLSFGCYGCNVERFAISLGIVDAVVVYDIELWLGVHDAFPYVGIIVVGSFGAIYYRATLYGYKSAVGFYLVVSLYCAYRHIKVYAYLVAILHAREVYITIIAFYGLCVAVVYFYAVGWSDAVVVFVQVAWDNLVFHPSWDAYLEVEVFASLIFDNLYLDVAIPRIFGCHFENNWLAVDKDGCCVRGKKVKIYVVVLYCIHVSRNRRDKTAKVTWAACATKPRLACCCAVGIELVFAVA